MRLGGLGDGAMSDVDVNLALCRVLGIPTDCQRATIVLEPGRLPSVTVQRLIFKSGDEIAQMTERFQLIRAPSNMPADREDDAHE